MEYEKNKGIFVGNFNEEDLKNGIDKIKVKEMKEKTNLKYTNDEIIYKKNKPISIKIWVCTAEDFKI